MPGAVDLQVSLMNQNHTLKKLPIEISIYRKKNIRDPIGELFLTISVVFPLTL